MSDKNNELLHKATQIVSQDNNLQPIKITNGWKVVWNHFPAVDPLTLHENSPKWLDFSEDMAYFKNDKFEIDLGWYGNLNQDGHYSISFLKSHETIATFTSQNITEVTCVLNYFFAIPYLE